MNAQPIRSDRGKTMKDARTNESLGTHLDLPMITTFTVKQTGPKAIAHALDFDLIATAETKPEALKKLRAAVKRHIEFGFKNSLDQNEIQQKAPKEYWDKIEHSAFALGEDIEIDNHLPVVTRMVIDETQPSTVQAF
jgi:hypothetical protein